jgi:hypothetical protein
LYSSELRIQESFIQNDTLPMQRFQATQAMLPVGIQRKALRNLVLIQRMPARIGARSVGTAASRAAPSLLL